MVYEDVRNHKIDGEGATVIEIKGKTAKIRTDPDPPTRPHLLSILQGKELKEVKLELPIIYMEHQNDEYLDVPEMNSTSQYINVLSIKTPLFKYDQMCGPSNKNNDAYFKRMGIKTTT